MQRWLLLALRIGLGGVLLYAGYVKWRMPWISFAAQVEAYKLLDPDQVVFVAKTLPLFEMALGAALIFGFGLRWFALAATALLAAFWAVQIRSYLMGMSIDCGCFGPGDRLSMKTLLRDGALVAGYLALSVLAFLQTRKKTALAERPSVHAAPGNAPV